MSDFENSREQRREARKKWMQEKWGNSDFNEGHGRGGAWTGVFILLIGVAAFLKVYMPELPRWIFSWPTLLITIGLFIGVRHQFKGAAWFVLIIVGSVFLYDKMNIGFSLRPYIWPVGLIAIGIFLIVRPRRKSCRDWYEKKNTGMSTTTPLQNDETWSDEDFVDSTSFFGGTKKNILSKKFKGGDLVNVFGGTDLDLTQADFTGTAVLELTTIFGGTKLIVPSNWSIKSEAMIMFGSIEDKRKMHTVTETPDKTLVLRGTVIFGGIDIKSY
jgi:predicted membrane protein